MLILGKNEGGTVYGKNLKDGAVCLLDDDRVHFALAEERVTRVKQASGTAAALRRLESQTGVTLADVEYIATSSCCEAVRPVGATSGPHVSTVNHHLSHACSAFFLSPFDEALIAVVDGGGNLLGTSGSSEWWRHEREQHSYYLGRGNGIELLARDCDRPYAMGLGEFYRAVTHFLGWPSSEYCGNVMALAGLGSAPAAWPHAFTISATGSIEPAMRNSPLAPESAIEAFLELYGIDLDRRNVATPLNEEHIQVAAWAQREVERIFFERIARLMNELKIYNLCLAGGFALNCSLAGKLWENTPVTHISIPIAPGDSGQCLGNALFVRHVLLQRSKRIVLSSPALGGAYDTSPKRLQRLLSQQHLNLRLWVGSRVLEMAARMIGDGKLIGLFNGRSEFGPRALGYRSILGDPRATSTKSRLNTAVKQREPFMPYALSVLYEDRGAWFTCGDGNSFMQFAFGCSPQQAARIPAAVHADGTARLQTVTPANSPILHQLLQHFRTLTGIPIVLNTSMNVRGEPIVETPEEAVELFNSSRIDGIVFDSSLLVTRHDVDLSASLNELAHGASVSPSERRSLSIAGGTDLQGMRRAVNEAYPDVDIVVRHHFGLRNVYFDWLVQGRKVTTVRYMAGAAELPAAWTLPLRVESVDNEVIASRTVTVDQVEVLPYAELTESDARADGFSSLAELRSALTGIYGSIPATAVVSLYRINLVSSPPPHGG